MKRITQLCLPLLLFSMGSMGQLTEGLPALYQPGVTSYQPADSTQLTPLGFFKPGETNYSIDVGTGFTSIAGGPGFSSSYISPSVSITPTERLQLQVGGRFSYANMDGVPMAGSTSSGWTPQQQGMGNPTEAFAFGRYLVSDRFSIYGMGAFGQNQLYYSPFNGNFATSDYQQFEVGMDYKIGKKTTIGASFGYTNSPAWGSPYGHRSNFSRFPY